MVVVDLHRCRLLHDDLRLGSHRVGVLRVHGRAARNRHAHHRLRHGHHRLTGHGLGDCHRRRLARHGLGDGDRRLLLLAGHGLGDRDRRLHR